MKPITQFDTCARGYGFGVPTFYSTFHLGTDFIVPKGTPVYAVQAGLVQINNLADTGNMVTLIGKDYTFRYMHLSQFSVTAGQTVPEGFLLGYSGGRPGDSGAGESTGEHLHFDIYKGYPVMPSNHAGFLDPETFNYATMRYLSAFKPSTGDTIYGIVAFENPDELHAAGFTDNSHIHPITAARLLKKTGEDPVYLSFQNPVPGFEFPFTNGQVSLEEVPSLTFGGDNGQAEALQSKIDRAKLDLQ